MMQHPRTVGSGFRFERRDEGTAAESALSVLRDRILTGELEPGAKLNQEALARDLGMSRIPVRDAIRALATEGLVSHDPGRTAIVAPLSSDDLAELYELRIAVEPHASSLAVPRLAEEEIEAMAEDLEAMASAHKPAAWLELHDRFHAALYRRSGRPRMIALLDRARAQTRRYTGIRLDRETEDIHAEHQLILSAIRRRDARSLRSLVSAHLTAGQESLSDRLAPLISPNRSNGRGSISKGGDARIAMA